MKEREIKALFPEGIETLTISKNDYDRLYGEMTLENIELKQELERLHSIIKEVREDIKYCIPVLEQEEEMSTDERSRKETGELKEILQKSLGILDKVDKEN